MSTFHAMAHLQREIRPSLMQAQQELASHFSFQLGGHVKANGVELYAFKISCYPLKDIVRLEGYSVKNDGKPAQTATVIKVKENY